METPEKGKVIECEKLSIDDELYLHAVYSMGFRLVNGNLECAESISIKDNRYLGRIGVKRWRYPGETDWRR